VGLCKLLIRIHNKELLPAAETGRWLTKTSPVQLTAQTQGHKPDHLAYHKQVTTNKELILFKPTMLGRKVRRETCLHRRPRRTQWHPWNGSRSRISFLVWSSE
jgi:hypothetical protein